MPLDPLLQPLLAGFVDESQEICDRITRGLLELERVAGRLPAGAFDELSRGLHTLKGSASTLGLDELAEVAHRMEDVLGPVQRRLVLPAQVADALLCSLDAWMSRLRATVAGSHTQDLSGTCQLLEDTRRQAEAAAALPDPERRSPSPLSAAPRVGDISITHADDPAAEASWRVGNRQVSALLHDVERLREIRLRLEERQRELERGRRELARLGRELRRATRASAGTALPSPDETRSALAALSRGLGADIEETSDIVASLEDGLRAISTQPMGTILEPLRRAVRDLCRQSGKRVALSLVGGEVSLDRRLLDALRSPLVHLVRNALDHGIEAPDVRERRGKHAEGALVVRVERQGNMLFIEVGDDGNGVDLEKVREAAQRRGLHGADELAAMGPAALQQLIFSSGLSTRATVSELSGRGVGLDIVRSQLQGLHGQVEVQSVPGQGARFVLSLPADLGSSAVLVVRCGDHQVGIPTMAIEASRAVRRSDVSATRGRMRYAHRDELIPLHDLGAILGLREPEPPRDDQPLLILSSQGRRLALALDEVFGDRELVIRPLPPEVRDLPAFQGAATLARGELVLILRPDWLAAAEERSEAPRAARLALIVGHSPSARTLHRAALEAGGFVVHAASNASQALEQLGRASYEVVVAEGSREGFDGFALSAAIRARPETWGLPVVLVASSAGGGDRLRAAEAGADGFITKRECGAGRLLAELATAAAHRAAAGSAGG